MARMRVRTFAGAVQDLDKLMDEVCDRCEPVVIRRRGRRPVIIMSLQEYGGFRETLRLLSNPRNAADPREAIAQANRGEPIEHPLIES